MSNDPRRGFPLTPERRPKKSRLPQSSGDFWFGVACFLVLILVLVVVVTAAYLAIILVLAIIEYLQSNTNPTP